ncbi:hypothetical protein HYALB_00008447 [Hymenoscyphus albidus]|uniref:Homing endonuclease LAGLIDADG domain-containing protein n=1 Tax=Hymenoscyphus albidus TaxID=595503 RepID=A0A9N9Q7G9_9HELO|nr:hypothetical protein HYALB_00008447 [Hymenoscyphus albidus]
MSAGKAAIDYRVLRFKNITDIVVPLFKQNPILGVKSLDFVDWCLRRAAELIKLKAHLTPEGLEQIQSITPRYALNIKQTEPGKILAPGTHDKKEDEPSHDKFDE